MIGPSILKLLTLGRDVYPLVDDRIYFGVRPQNVTLPAIVLTQVSRTTPRTFTGTGGYELGRMQVDVLADTYRGAQELAEGVRKTLDGYSGSGDRPSIEIDRLEIEDSRDMPSVPKTGRSTPVFGVSLDAVYQSREDT